jgi:hypothetical protein
MQIRFVRSGGFTGIPLTIQVDTATLPPDQAAQIGRLVESADFFHLPETRSASTQPDRYEYELSIQNGDQGHIVSFEEAAMPESLRPLLSYLMETAQHP